MMLSVVVPCRNEAQSLPVFFEALRGVAAQMRAARPELSFELVLVDDGSTDATLDAMRMCAARAAADPAGGIAVVWLSFSRNFGKEAALYAGLRRAKGGIVATMDADMQDPPSLLPAMLDELMAGDWDDVAARRVSRAGEPPIRSACARLFYRVANSLSDTEIVDGARDFRLMRRRMVDAVLSLPERNRFSKGIFSWVGFKTKWVAFEHADRVAGETNWSFWQLVRYAVDGIVGFSVKPLSVASGIGLALCLASLVAAAVIAVRAALFGDPVAGWPSLACIVTFIGGLQLMCLGIIGQYLAKVYIEVKQRPLYVVRLASDDEPPAGGAPTGSARR